MDKFRKPYEYKDIYGYAKKPLKDKNIYGEFREFSLATGH